MTTIADIPVTVTEEATQHVAELGLQKEFKQVLDRALQTIPGLRSLQVGLQPGYGYDIPVILLEGIVSDFEAACKSEEAWGLWRLTEIDPRKGQHFGLLLAPEL